MSRCSNDCFRPPGEVEPYGDVGGPGVSSILLDMKKAPRQRADDRGKLGSCWLYRNRLARRDTCAPPLLHGI